MKTFYRILSALLLSLALTVPAAAQTSIDTTTVSTLMTASQNYVVLASATGVEVGGGIYIDREYMTVASSWVSGTRVPVIRGVAGVNGSHAVDTPVYVGPAKAFQRTDRSGQCVAAEQAYLPWINVVEGGVYHCSSTVEKWVNLRDRIAVTCRALLIADMIDQSCFQADRPYLVVGIVEVHTTAESAGTLTLIPRRQQSTEAVASGDALATAIDMVGAGAVAQTVKTATLTSSEAFLILATGDRLGLDFTDDVAGELAGVTVTFYLVAM